MRTNKAISPILATVILIAVTLVIAIGVVGWIMGIWGTLGTVETLQILYHDSKLKANGAITLHVRNTGTASAVIYKIEIVGVGTATIESIVPPGVTTTITATITGTTTLTPGLRY
ncbi:MAG: archaellin/type IV pilin N-terminal domain-containing protein, partial [Desulfurococcaceae archaeon TW002]